MTGSAARAPYGCGALRSWPGNADQAGLTEGIIYDGTTKGLMAQSGQPHARLRRLVSAAFTPRQVERLRPRLRAYLAGLWQDIAQAGRCDVVSALARPLPSMAIAELLGVPGAGRPACKQCSTWT